MHRFISFEVSLDGGTYIEKLDYNVFISAKISKPIENVLDSYFSWCVKQTCASKYSYRDGRSPL